ncbi:MAG TPA: hypothetical protein VN132_01470 [Bdellovibrio sp.]|nr:hypothetical protein [Bdellovibrio sp.]
MNPVKQALSAFKNNWKESLWLGAAATIYTYFAQLLPMIGALFISLGLLIFQEIVNKWMKTGRWSMDLTHLKNHWVAFVLISIVLMPTGILLGSAFGLLESPQSEWQNIPLSFALFILGIYFYFILAHAFSFSIETTKSVAKAIDSTAIVSMKRYKIYLPTAFFMSLIFMLAGFLRGLGLVIALPLLFFSSAVIYQDVRSLLKN